MIVWLTLVLAAPGVPAPEPVAADRERMIAFARAHRRTQLAGMGVLTGWALANIGGGLAGYYLDRDRRFFHQGNAIWNSVNLAIGIAGLVGNSRKRVPEDLARADRLSRKTARTYFINGAIDVVYIAAGAATIAIGQHYRQRRVQGYGQAIAFQGAFLFAFDTAMVLAHARVRERRLRPAADIRAGSGSLSLTGRF
ncbi:MAG: hypothetical protein IAG13_03670 [Deltaproteobacteria bacterium]|nr:hypothetical protein [Nannocystaceae bacterium]